MKELEKNTQEHKVFDPVKAKAQIDVYKEIYNLMDKEDSSGSDYELAYYIVFIKNQFMVVWSTYLLLLGDNMRLLSAASEKEKQKLAEYFSGENLNGMSYYSFWILSKSYASCSLSLNHTYKSFCF